MDCIHDGQKVSGGDGDILLRLCGSARPSNILMGSGHGGRGHKRDRFHRSRRH